MDIMVHSEPRNPPVPSTWDSRDRDHLVLLRGITWEQYEAIDRARGADAGSPIIAYLDGELELVTTSTRHERVKKMLARLVEAYAEERGLRLDGYGMATLHAQQKRAGIEPDEWYVTKSDSETPDLAFEIVFTSGGVDKLEIYRRFQVSEVWFWIDGRIWIYRLAGTVYEECAASVELPGIDLRVLERIIATVSKDGQTEAVKAYRRTLTSPG